MTPTGTVTAEKAGANVRVSFTVPAADFIDLIAGLAWVDVLGGFGAWRLVLPVGDQPARVAGQFNLRRTYAEPTTAPEAGAHAGGRASDSPAARDPCGCADRGTARGAEARGADQPNGAGAAAVDAPNGLSESARQAIVETLGDCVCGHDGTLHFSDSPHACMIWGCTCHAHVENVARMADVLARRPPLPLGDPDE